MNHKKCPHCGLKAYRSVGKEPSPPNSTLTINECMVCDLKEPVLLVTCTDCNRWVEIKDMGEGECDHCGLTVDADDLVDRFTPGYDPKDEEPDNAYCTFCERTDAETVVPSQDGYFCVSCFSHFTRIGTCGFCNSRNAGDIDSVDSYLSGCVACEGMVSQDHT